MDLPIVLRTTHWPEKRNKIAIQYALCTLNVLIDQYSTFLKDSTTSLYGMGAFS